MIVRLDNFSAWQYSSKNAGCTHRPVTMVYSQIPVRLSAKVRFSRLISLAVARRFRGLCFVLLRCFNYCSLLVYLLLYLLHYRKSSGNARVMIFVVTEETIWWRHFIYRRRLLKHLFLQHSLLTVCREIRQVRKTETGGIGTTAGCWRNHRFESGIRTCNWKGWFAQWCAQQW